MKVPLATHCSSSAFLLFCAAVLSYASLLVPKLWHWNFSYTKDSAAIEKIVVEVL